MKCVRDLEIFVQAADAGSLTAAAHRLDLTPAAASVALKRLEAELAVPLFVRSTRSLRLTPEGEAFLAHCRQALRLLADGRDAIAGGGPELRGELQLSVPSGLGRTLVLPWLDEFLARHPGLRIRLLLSDRLADVYREPVELALRYGSLPDSGLIALPVAPANRRIPCASPAYVARFGAPDDPRELAQRDCLRFQLGDAVHERWRFFRGGDEVAVQVSGRRVADDGDAVLRWALAGHGIAYKSALDVAPDLAAGRLVALCPAWTGEPVPLHLLCADRRRIGPLVQALRAFLAQRCDEVLAGIGLPAGDDLPGGSAGR